LINCDNQGNNCVLLENGTVVLVLNFVQTEDNTKLIIGKKLKYVKNLYLLPYESNTFNIQIVIENDRIRVWPCEKIEAKMWKMPYKDNLSIVFPIIHT